MKKKISLIITILIFISSCSCSGDNYSKIDMWKMAEKVDPDVEIVLAKDIAEGLQAKLEYDKICVDYEAIGAHTFKVHMLNMVAVELANEEQARDLARKIGAYYVRNWVLDDVTGEPILERFVKKAFNAKKVGDKK